MEAGKRQRAGDKARTANADEAKDLRRSRDRKTGYAHLYSN